MNLAVDEVLPGGDPLLEECAILALHHLIAAREVRRYPAADVPQAIGGETPAFPEAFVDWPGIAVPEVLNDHEEHREFSERQSESVPVPERSNSAEYWRNSSGSSVMNGIGITGRSPPCADRLVQWLAALTSGRFE
jgi:hypothetical protein